MSHGQDRPVPFCCCAGGSDGSAGQCIGGDNNCCITHGGHSYPWTVCTGVGSSGDLSYCRSVAYCCCDPDSGQCVGGDGKCCASWSGHPQVVPNYGGGSNNACIGIGFSYGHIGNCPPERLSKEGAKAIKEANQTLKKNPMQR